MNNKKWCKVEREKNRQNCPFGDECTDRGIKCNYCKYNIKRSYYEPQYRYYNPGRCKFE